MHNCILEIERNEHFFLFFNGQKEIWIRKDAIDSIEYFPIQILKDFLTLFIKISAGNKNYYINCSLFNTIGNSERLKEIRENFQEYIADKVTQGLGLEIESATIEEK